MDFIKKRDFSYPEMVSIAVKKCIEVGGKEMREGYYNTRMDNQGNISRVYVEDTRLEFIESVEQLKAVLEREFDNDAKKNIKSHYDSLKKIFNVHYEMEKKEWNSLSYKEKIKRTEKGRSFKEGTLIPNSFCYNSFLADKVKVMRGVLSELLKLTKRFGDFKTEVYGEEKDEIADGDDNFESMGEE